MVKKSSALVAESQNAVNAGITSPWHQVVTEIHLWQKMKHLTTTQLVVVLPFVQLIAPVRLAWGEVIGNGFLPRIETTQTWAARIGSMHVAGLGPHLNSALDNLQAREWLKRVQNENTLEFINALVTPLVDMATELTHAAGAIAPWERENYWKKADFIAEQIPPGVAGVEAALGPLAVAWAKATEKWATDALFILAQDSNNIKRKEIALIVVQAGGEDPLTYHLYQHWNKSSRLWLNLDDNKWFFPKSLAVSDTRSNLIRGAHKNVLQYSFNFDQKNILEDVQERSSQKYFHTISNISPPQWQRAQDAEDEAQRAAAQIITLLNTGVMPVALCSQDRPIARRIGALLNRHGIPIADETGWTLSTTRCAAFVMGLIKAASPQATTDHVLDAFKTFPENANFVHHLDAMELYLRKTGQANWPQKKPLDCAIEIQTLWQKINDLLNILRENNIQHQPLAIHLHALTRALKKSTAWSVLMADVAGREIIQVLHLDEITDQMQEQNNKNEQTSPSAFIQKAQAAYMSYLEFMHWVDHAFESMTFIPPAPEQPQVVLTPLARIMLRPFAAVVIPGCDDSRLTASPHLSGFWSESDRVTLGMMNRTVWWKRLQAQWAQALRLPNVTLIWRTSEGSQPLGPATLVQRVISPSDPKSHKQQLTETRVIQQYEPVPEFAPAPKPEQCFTSPIFLTASAYRVLRDCPYKYYAQYLLNLRELAELDGELTRRDYGNWLHAVLRDFHEKREQPDNTEVLLDSALLDKCAQEHARALDQATLIPWQARWPALRDAYLNWLHQYERDGGHFLCAEFSMQYILSSQITLQGRIDRLDQKDTTPIFIDYKTERRSKTESRVKDAYEDVQLPFYALLAQGQMPHQPDIPITQTENARAIYLSLDDRENLAKAIEQTALQEVKILLAQSMIHDIDRLQHGFPAYPIGQGQTCDYCAVKGLCRKDHWTSPVSENNTAEVVRHKPV